MANFYLSSVDGNDGTPASVSWWNGNQNTYATLAGVLAAMSAGDRVYVDDAHSEIAAATFNLVSNGTTTSWCEILCVDRDTGALAETALLSSSIGSSTAIGTSGYAYVYGLTFKTTSVGNLSFIPSAGGSWILDHCTLNCGTNSSGDIGIGTGNGNSDASVLRLINSTIVFGHASQGIASLTAPFEMFGGSIGGTAAPNTLFKSFGASGDSPGRLRMVGVDLSALGSGKSLFNVAANIFGYAFLESCKLGSGVALTTGTMPAGPGGLEITLVNSDSGDTNYRYEKYCYQGEIKQEATIVRSGGASDGTTAISRKMVSSANSKFYSPLESSPIVVWNETVGSPITVTVEVVTDNVTLTDAEAWIEVEYLGTSGFPISSVASDRAANILATPANQTTSSATWTTTGLTTPVKQKLSVTFTPQEKGSIRVRVMLAKASTTMYYCPKAEVS